MHLPQKPLGQLALTARINSPICLDSNPRPAKIACGGETLRSVKEQRQSRPLVFHNRTQHTHGPGEIVGACERQGPYHSVAIPDEIAADAGCG